MNDLEMKDSFKIADLTKNLDVYINFFYIYKKKNRSKKREYLVNKIILTENLFPDRIKKIQLLEEYFKTKVLSPEIKYLFIKKKEDDFPLRKKIRKAMPIKNSIYFIFFSRKKAIQFSKNTKAVHIGFLGKKAISNEFIDFLNNFYLQVKSYIMENFYRILITGWQYLDYLDYNILVVFYDCLLFISKELSKPKEFILHIEEVEKIMPKYLGIVANEDYKKRLYNSFSLILSKNISYKDQFDSIILLFEKLIDINAKNLTFFNSMLTVYLMHYNQYISKEELVDQIGKISITNQKYLFLEKSIKENISETIYKMDSKIEDLEKELFHLHYIDQDITKAELSHPWISLLNFFFNQRFWNLSFTKNEDSSVFILYSKENFTSFHDDLENSIIKLTASFIEFVKKFFLSPLTIEKDGKNFQVSICNKDFLIEEIELLDKIIFEYKNKDFSGFSTPLTLKLYLSYAKGLTNILEKEKKTYIAIDKLVKVYKKLALKFSDVIIAHNLILRSKNVNLENNQPISIELIQKKYKKLIPFYSNIVIFKDINGVNGWTVFDLFNKMAYYCFNLVYLLSEKDLLKEVLKIENILADFDHLLNSRARLYNSLES